MIDTIIIQSIQFILSKLVGWVELLYVGFRCLNLFIQFSMFHKSYEMGETQHLKAAQPNLQHW